MLWEREVVKQAFATVGWPRPDGWDRPALLESFVDAARWSASSVLEQLPLQAQAKKLYPYSMPPASREYTYGGDTCPAAQQFRKTFIRWSTFCEKYDPEHCELAASIVREVADRNRR